MKLYTQPDDGITPLVQAIKRATKAVAIVIFRFDLKPLEQALTAAVTRGIPVRALIAHTNRGGEMGLRKLEQRLLEGGITVARTGDDLIRYHGKILIVDDTLFVLGFNYTRLDIERSRSFGVMVKDARLVKAAADLFESDATRQAYTPNDHRLVVSPENAREALGTFITSARKSLAIYDMNVSDPRMLKLLEQRVRAGVEVRIIGGKVKKAPDGLGLRKLVKLRLHARAMISDGTRLFIGSQSLRRMELDQRREVGIIATDARVARRMLEVFDMDWENAKPKLETAAALEEKKEAKEAKAEDKEKAATSPSAAR